MNTAWKGCGVVAAVIVVLGIIALVFVIPGSPLGSWLARQAMEEYLAETYPGKQFVFKRVFYDIKFDRYQAEVVEGPGNAFILAGTSKGVQYDQYRYTYAMDAARTEAFSAQFSGELEALIAPVTDRLSGIEVDLYIPKDADPRITQFERGMEVESDIEIFLMGEAVGRETFTHLAAKIRDAVVGAGYRPRSLRFLYNEPEMIAGKSGPLLYTLKISAEQYRAGDDELLAGIEEFNQGKPSVR